MSEAEGQPRRAIFSDMESVAKLHRFSFFDAMPHMPVLHTPEEDLNFYSTVVFQNTEIWISERSDLTVGIISFRPGWIEHLYVHPNHQGAGIGSTLLALAQSTQHSLRLWTFQCNLGARRFYERRGFRIEKETDGADNEERQPDILYIWERHTTDPQSRSRRRCIVQKKVTDGGCHEGDNNPTDFHGRTFASVAFPDHCDHLLDFMVKWAALQGREVRQLNQSSEQDGESDS